MLSRKKKKKERIQKNKSTIERGEITTNITEIQLKENTMKNYMQKFGQPSGNG